MKSSTIAFALWFALASVGASAGTVHTDASRASAGSPRFNGSRLPLPPMQRSRWTFPETKLPTNYVSATRLLFEQGLADPRDCTYRAIEVGVGNVWGGDGGVVKTHGWVLPGSQSAHFAVCWNGLVYPVVSVGTNADLEADVANLMTNRLARWHSAILEEASVSEKSLLGIKGCLLLRLGRIDLAARYWQVQVRYAQEYRNARSSAMWLPGMPAGLLATNGEVKLPDSDPYLVWATEWTWAMFDRTICAHMRGDEALALVTARQLSEVQPKIEAECTKRGVPQQKNWGLARQEQPRPYLDFLEQLPQVLADLERRAKEGNRVSVIESGLQNITSQSDRIAALIRDLDLVQARQMSQPGGVNLPEDPIVTALIQEGDPAVEPLLDCLETDKRLTHSRGG